MRHLILPFFCAVVVGLLLALLARAIYTGSASFVLVALAGIAYFGWHGWNDARRCWPAFRAEMQRRTDAAGQCPPTTRTEQPPARATGLRLRSDFHAPTPFERE